MNNGIQFDKSPGEEIYSSAAKKLPGIISRFGFNYRFDPISRIFNSSGKIKNITKFKDGTEVQGTAHLFEHLFDFAANQSDACLLILPGLSPQSGFIYTQYPAIKAEAAQLHLLLESMRKRLTQVDYLALVSEKLKYGVVLDVYAGNPETHGTNKEICQITTW